MKLIFKSIAMLVVTVGVLGYGTYLMTGRFPWQGLRLSEKPDIKLPEGLTLPAQKAAKQLVYKWKDTDGVWHFSTEAPADGSVFEQLEIDPNTNVIASVPVEIADEEIEPAEKSLPDKPDTGESPVDFPYSPDRVKKLMDDARDVQKTLNDRAEKQKAILDSL